MLLNWRTTRNYPKPCTETEAPKSSLNPIAWGHCFRRAACTRLLVAIVAHSSSQAELEDALVGDFVYLQVGGSMSQSLRPDIAGSCPESWTRFTQILMDYEVL